MRNATRHPQADRASGESTTNITEASRDADSVPAPTETCCHMPAEARRPGSAFSTRKAAEVPNSPPAEKPCRLRPMTNKIGAATPMVANVGVRAINADAPAIIRIVRVIPARLPWRSAYEPSSAPPSGRTKNPTAKTANTPSNCAIRSDRGKKDAAKYGAKKP